MATGVHTLDVKFPIHRGKDQAYEQYGYGLGLDLLCVRNFRQE